MSNLFKNPGVIKVFNFIRPWATFIALLVILRYTGALAGISVYANTALLKTGVMDIDTKSAKYEEPFDYNFTVKDLNGKVVKMGDLKGKVIFLNLWATWCGPCIAELPSIQALYEKSDKDKIAFIILDWFEEPGKVSKFVERKKFTFPVYVVNGDVPSQLNVPSIPTTFVINQEGNIVTKKSGTANYDTEKFIKYLQELK